MGRWNAKANLTDEKSVRRRSWNEWRKAGRNVRASAAMKLRKGCVHP